MCNHFISLFCFVTVCCFTTSTLLCIMPAATVAKINYSVCLNNVCCFLCWYKFFLFPFDCSIITSPNFHILPSSNIFTFKTFKLGHASFPVLLRNSHSPGTELFCFVVRFPLQQNLMWKFILACRVSLILIFSSSGVVLVEQLYIHTGCDKKNNRYFQISWVIYLRFSHFFCYVVLYFDKISHFGLSVCFWLIKRLVSNTHHNVWFFTIWKNGSKKLH